MNIKTILLGLSLLINLTSFAQEDDDSTKVNKQKGEPLEGMDCSWWNGGDRRSTPMSFVASFGPSSAIGSVSTKPPRPSGFTICGSS